MASRTKVVKARATAAHDNGAAMVSIHDIPYHLLEDSRGRELEDILLHLVSAACLVCAAYAC
uniref:Uncharacterized protein n=1 Tax=Leersia perrieri TaxID=77586 RepID=A0A0D9XCP4_9ORYZ